MELKKKVELKLKIEKLQTKENLLFIKIRKLQTEIKKIKKEKLRLKINLKTKDLIL